MTPGGSGTFGERLDRRARALLSRRSEPARRRAGRAAAAHEFDPPAARRLRVEADVPPAWEAEYGADATPARPTGQPFPTELRERLAPLVGPGLEHAVVHDGDHDPTADALAGTHDAAAVTVGRQIFLRQGRFRPGSADGRGLLAHEAVHAVLATRPGAGWRRATAGGRASEERLAHDLAAAVIDPRAGWARPVWADTTDVDRPPSLAGATGALVAGRPIPPSARAYPSSTPRPVHPGAPGGAVGPVGRATSTPMAAPAGTPEPVPPSAGPGPGPGPGPTPDAVLRDLMRRMRVDRERGA